MDIKKREILFLFGEKYKKHFIYCQFLRIFYVWFSLSRILIPPLASVPSDSIACPLSLHPASSPSASIFPISIPQSFPPSHSVPGIAPW